MQRVKIFLAARPRPFGHWSDRLRTNVNPFRIGFYLRAGARTTAIESRLFGVRYLVLALPCGGTVTDAAVSADLRRIYGQTVPEPYYRGNVIFYGG